MPTHIALLRGINVGGKNILAMNDLKSMLHTLGFPNAASLLQSGNLLFDIPTTHNLSDLELHFQLETEKRHHFSPDYFLRTAKEWKTLVASNPFPTEAENDPGHLIVMFLKSKPTPKNMRSLQLTIQGPEKIAANNRELYITYPLGLGTSKLTNTAIEKHLTLRGTARNWNTLQKIAAAL